ncbi:alpha/beta hydrolase [Kribbella albertanoniae]|uniref:Alpha/beta hydrolase n=1 Tax=Kribbella albertanoniae TaxID=1266829 RepID=A0A4R4P9A2_9ACTN|nr:alpha/beta hydrolase [Kribbella albertanoniae]TDC17523.1 alpha/beta hydrolase [Kribbella albertanoniae]
MELQGVSHRFVDLPGVRLHVAEAGSGEAVVLLHGFPQQWWEWRDVIPALAQHYRVICPDLRGFGESSAPATGYDRESLLADLIGLLDALELDRVHLLTHDWSGILGTLLCLRHPERVRDHLMLAIPPLGAKPDAAMFGRMMRHGWFNLVLPWPGLGPWALRRTGLAKTMLRDHSVGMPDDLVELFASQFQDPARAVAGSALYRQFIQREGMRLMRGEYPAAQLTTPTRVLIGAEDRVVRADANSHEIPGASHFIVDDRPDAVVEHAREFFN